MVKKHGDIIAILVIALMAFISFSPFILKGHLINSDSWKNYFPWRAEYDLSEIKTNYLDPNVEYGIWYPMAKEEISKGRFPNWNPYSFCGAPLYSNHLVPVFHIPFAIALLWPARQVATVYSLLMAFGGAIFFYLFLRNWRLSPLVSLFGTSAYLFSGWMILTHPPEVTTLLWMPAILLFHDRFLERGRLLDASLGALAIGQILIAGYPVYVVHFSYLALIYVLWRRFGAEFTPRVSVRRWLSGVLMMLIFGVLISAVQNYPTYEYMRLCQRGISPSDANIEMIDSVMERNQRLVEDKGLWQTVKMVFWKQVTEKSSFMIPVFMWNRGKNFIGTIVLFLGLCALFTVDRKFRIMKILLVIFSILVFIPHANTIFVKTIPGWSISALHLPAQSFFFLLFFFACLGLNRLITLESKNPTCVFLGILMLILLFALPRLHPLYMLDPLEQIFRWNPTRDIIFFAAYITVTALILVLLLLKSSARLKGNFWTGIIVIAFLLTGLAVSKYHHYLFDSSDPMPLTDEIEQVRKITSDGRIARYDPAVPVVMFTQRIDSVFPPNIPARWEIYDTQGYDSLILRNYSDFLSLVDPSAFLTGRGVKHYRNVEALSKNGLLEYGAGLRYIITRGDLPLDDLKPIYGDPIHRGGMNVFKIDEPSDAFFRFISNYEIKKDDFATVELTPWKIILEKDPTMLDGQLLPSVDNAFKDFKVEDLKRTLTEISFRFTAPSDGLLYIAETWHPRWRAELDKKEVEILRANIAFRAIAIPQGTHVIHMWYDGIEVVRGGIVSALAILIVFAIAFLDIRKHQKERNL